MEFKTEITSAIASGFDGFQNFIRQKLKENASYLEQMHWMPDGSQINVVNLLIQEHQESLENSAEANTNDMDLSECVLFVLKNSIDKNIGEPLHQAIRAKKYQLALKMLRSNKKIEHAHPSKTTSETLKPTIETQFDCNRRDSEGTTLLAVILDSKNEELLIEILASNPDIYASSKIGNPPVFLQPLHQSVLLNFTEGSRLLIESGAQLANPAGPVKETPILLAARSGAIDTMGILLTQSLKKLDIEAENNEIHPTLKTGYQAIEVLCKRMSVSKQKKEALRGVAMLLCSGAEPPRDEKMRSLLSSNRSELLKAVHSYLEQKPELVDDFVKRCHMYGSALHDIVYAEHSWGSSMRRLFGRPSDVAFKLESLVNKKYKLATPMGNTLFKPVESKILEEQRNLKLYAEFVRRYKIAYDGQLVTNSWSTMRWMIAEGRCNWKIVENYVKSNPKSRSRIVYDEMLRANNVELHEDNDKIVDEKVTLSC